MNDHGAAERHGAKGVGGKVGKPQFPSGPATMSVDYSKFKKLSYLAMQPKVEIAPDRFAV